MNSNAPNNREKEIFEQALDLPSGAERQAFVQGACGADAALCARVLALLMAHATGEDFLPEEPKAPATVVLSVTEKVGDKIGHYRLMEKLGEGGCGIVYVAEQEEPVRRKVALKVIKLGMDTREVVARFEAERQALALMDHPNIARVFDGGATDTGRPYFVLELVRGVRITEFCDQHQLPTVERLKLLIQVCHAIQHAHQKGIIHRDIKPSNILVSLHDDLPVPKVIDFGIAKAVGERLTDKTVYTRYAQFLGTPAYMSPEQAGRSDLDVDTRSDIYALGVLLYELLAGRPPFDPKQLAEAGLEAMVRCIREWEPLQPSTRLSRLQQEELTTTAQWRGTEPTKLISLLRGDLDWIVMKCLEKNRTRRYDTANGLAQDIQHHLNSEPVTARPPSTAYRAQKFVRRNKLLVAAGGAVAAALLLGLAGSTWQAIRATRAEGRVKQALEREATQRRQAEQAQANEAQLRKQAQAQAYASDVSLAAQALATDDLGRARRLLEKHLPSRLRTPETGTRPAAAPGLTPDLRGWEWRHLWSLCESDALLTLGHYSNSITAITFSRDGRLLLARDAPGRTLFLDIARKAEIARVPSRAGRYRAMALSPNGSLLAAGTLVTGLTQVVNLWDVASRQKVAELPHPEGIRALAFSPGGSRLASFGTDATVRIWEVASRRVIHRFPASQTSSEATGVVKFSPDGKTLVIGETDGRIRLIELESNTERVILAHAEGITALAFLADGKILASTSAYPNTAILLWDVVSGGRAGQLTGHTAFIHDLAVAPDGHTLASASSDQTIRLWDVDRQQPLATLRGHELAVWAVAFSPDGNTLASGCKDGSIALWEVRPKPRSTARVTLPARVRRVAFSPDSATFYSLNTDGSVSVWDARSRQLTAAQSTLGSNNISLAVSPDGRLLVVGDEAGTLKVWDRGAARELTRVSAHPGFIRQLRFSTNSQVLVSGSMSPGNSVVQQWNTANWQEQARYNHDDVIYYGFNVSADGSLVVEGNGHGKLTVWNLPEARVVASWTPHFNVASALAFAPDGALLASGSADSSLRLFEVGTWRQVAVMQGHLHGISALAFSPDGRRLATSGLKEAVKLWDLATTQELLTLEGEGVGFDFTSFSPDGNTLIAINRSGTAHLWRPPSLQEIDAQLEARIKSP